MYDMYNAGIHCTCMFRPAMAISTHCTYTEASAPLVLHYLGAKL